MDEKLLLDSLIDSLNRENDENKANLLKELNKKWSNKFQFSDLTSDQRRFLRAKFSEKCSSTERPNLLVLELEFLKILSRDTTNDDDDDWPSLILIEMLSLNAGYAEAEHENWKNDDLKMAIINESQKCLCNFVFQYEKARDFCAEIRCPEGIIRRLNAKFDFDSTNLNLEITFYDLRLLFLLTALRQPLRSACRASALRPLTRLLIDVSKNLNLDNRSFDIVCEILKVYFNLILALKTSQLNEIENRSFEILVPQLRDLLFLECEKAEKIEDLRSNVINLLTAVPSNFYDLLTPEDEKSDLSFLDVLLSFLNGRLDVPIKDQREALSPILTLLTDMCRNHANFRRYVRKIVLPPLKDVHSRPEEGTTMRNRLVKLMTSVTDVSLVSAEFLFQICNCNVDRMIKYTGFGNAAGMLAHRGLLSGGHSVNGQSSGEESCSDTEEYLSAKDRINPVLGCTETPRLPPMQGMSDEQKEYEAMKLVDEINKLMDRGIVKPGRIGADGKIHPVEHILELQETSSSSRNEVNGDDSFSKNDGD